MIVDALRAKGVPVAYVTFEGEQHGFRQAANIRRALDGELSFYAQVFGFELPAAEGHRAGRDREPATDRLRRHDVEAEAEGDADLGRVERDEAHRRRHPFGGGEVDGAGQADGCSRASPAARSRQRWSTGTTWRWSHARRTASSRSGRRTASSVSGRSPAAPRRGRAPRRSTPGRRRARRARRPAARRRRRGRAAHWCRGRRSTVDHRAAGAGPSARTREVGHRAGSRGCESGVSVTATSPRARSRRTPTTPGPAAGATPSVRRGGTTAPPATRRSRSGAWSSSGPSCAGRPAADGDDDALALRRPAHGGGEVGAQRARRTASTSLSRVRRQPDRRRSSPRSSLAYSSNDSTTVELPVAGLEGQARPPPTTRAPTRVRAAERLGAMVEDRRRLDRRRRGVGPAQLACELVEHVVVGREVAPARRCGACRAGRGSRRAARRGGWRRCCAASRCSLLPLRSGRATWRSSSGLTKPGGPPRGETSQSAVGVGRRQEHERRRRQHRCAGRRRGGPRFFVRTRSRRRGVHRGQLRRRVAMRDIAPRLLVDTCVHKTNCRDQRQRGILRRMNFAFTDEQEELRKTVRAFLDTKSPEAAVREQMETEDGYDAAVWSRWPSSSACRACRSPRSSAAPATASSSSASCSRRWAGRCCARRSSPPSCSPPTRCCTPATTPPRRTTCRASPAARRSPRSPSPSRRASGTRPASRWRPPRDGDGWTLNGTKMLRARRPHRPT